ncbi:cadmium-translocating P-type ATPase [Cyanobacterium aponinum FACHB-4101]|uniref:heavy metal translocating P-type ATPase n=1 Tax=Cyanobacterium aponinum TaxID=379064 RepID=UPI0016806989|nr:heavy metal translocating P-type ATPase [Cyanobacterium aponinum]MBD2393308.1 cadmium-translocating P-type ATPase [Cyanobacterium aponinum FACHB-4101]
MGKHCCAENHSSHNHHHEKEDVNLKKEVISVIVVSILFIFGFAFENQLHNTIYSFGEYLVFIPAYLLAGWNVLMSAGKNIVKGKFFDENFLMTVATLGAFAIHKLPEAVAVMLFFKIGELFQELAVNRSRKSIKSLLEIRPDYANLQDEDGIKKVNPEQVNIGDFIVVKPGEKIPLDGEILEGDSQVDTSALTGESVPRIVRKGETVLAGMINQTGVLTLKVTKLFAESSITQILDLVENASSKKAPTQKFMSKFAQYYTPIVVFTSLAVALIPPLLIANARHGEWVYRALVLLVISCPCGLVISIPLGYFGGVGRAAKKGILVKGATYLDSLLQVKTIVFDKTGTLTKGVFQVMDIVPHNGFTKEELLAFAVGVETYSSHPIAESIRQAYEGEIDDSIIDNYQELAGYGVSAIIDGKRVIAGNDKLLHQENISHDTCNVTSTVVHLAVDNNYAGYILIADQIKEDATFAVSRLKELGIEKIVMLTGDNKVIASEIAKKLGLDSYQAELLPEDKVTALENLIHQSKEKEKVTVVGDGINDAPIIARADVGMAMGGLGSDAAIETADIVIMTDAPSKVPEAIEVARKTHHIVWQNIVFALAVKGLFIVLGTFGVASLWEAVFADVGVALVAIFNATRIINN